MIVVHVDLIIIQPDIINKKVSYLYWIAAYLDAVTACKEMDKTNANESLRRTTANFFFMWTLLNGKNPHERLSTYLEGWSLAIPTIVHCLVKNLVIYARL